ncbi:MAG: HepT-like ribonuclease domain-containing protein [Pseudonocardiaceae bacterium]
MRSDPDRVQDILEAIERVERHTGGGRAAFDTDELIQVWVVRHLQIIGEAASRLSDDARSRQPDIPWRKIIGMRHVLVHGYFDVDLDLVWSVVEHELAALRSAIAVMGDRPGPDSVYPGLEENPRGR